MLERTEMLKNLLNLKQKIQQLKVEDDNEILISLRFLIDVVATTSCGTAKQAYNEMYAKLVTEINQLEAIS